MNIIREVNKTFDFQESSSYDTLHISGKSLKKIPAIRLSYFSNPVI